MMDKEEYEGLMERRGIGYQGMVCAKARCCVLEGHSFTSFFLWSAHGDDR